MKLIVTYQSAIKSEPINLATIELPDEIVQEIALNMNTQVEHAFFLDLATTKYLGRVAAPIGGLR